MNVIQRNDLWYADRFSQRHRIRLDKWIFSDVLKVLTIIIIVTTLFARSNVIEMVCPLLGISQRLFFAPKNTNWRNIFVNNFIYSLIQYPTEEHLKVWVLITNYEQKFWSVKRVCFWRSSSSPISSKTIIYFRDVVNSGSYIDVHLFMDDIWYF